LYVQPLAEEAASFDRLRETHRCELQRMALFDLLANNADRKGGHCLLDIRGHVWGIDHGLTFNHVPKLRTVIWEFGGESIPPDVCGDLHRLLDDVRCGPLRDRLAPLLDRFELDALHARIEHLLTTGVLPEADGDYYAYPWPTI